MIHVTYVANSAKFHCAVSIWNFQGTYFSTRKHFHGCWMIVFKEHPPPCWQEETKGGARTTENWGCYRLANSSLLSSTKGKLSPCDRFRCLELGCWRNIDFVDRKYLHPVTLVRKRVSWKRILEQQNEAIENWLTSRVPNHWNLLPVDLSIHYRSLMKCSPSFESEWQPAWQTGGFRGHEIPPPETG